MKLCSSDNHYTTAPLKHIGILNTKGVDYGYILWGISKNDAISRLNNSVLKDKGVL